MAPAVNSGDEVLIPLYDAAEKTITVTWQQDFSARKANYYVFLVPNLTTGQEVPFYIASEFYKSLMTANPGHITKVAELIDGEGYKLKITDKIQYGQKNGEGEGRFAVYHDKERKPYQHRFTETTFASTAGKKLDEIAGKLGFAAAAAAGQLHDVAKAYIGDYLHDF